MDISASEIEAAHERIAPHIVRTPITHSRTFSELCGCEVYFKLENLQMTGAFKERGALNRLLELSADERSRGVIAASAGNHAQAVACHAARLGISAKIVMPANSPIVKIRSTEHWGAELVLHGDNFDEAFAHSQALVAEEGRVYLHPFDDPAVINGQGTIGLEILDDPLGREVDAVVVPVGGGGLVAGIATAIKAHRPEVRVIGVEESTCAAMAGSLAAGQVTELPPAPVIAEGIGVRRVSARNLEIVTRLVDEMASVSSDEIANAIMLMLEIEKMLSEGAAMVGLAALLNGRLPSVRGKKVLVVVSGGNIDVNLLAKIINRGLAFDGRVVRMNSVIADKPGALEALLGVFRASGANILEVVHHRFSGDAPVGQIGVSITVETRNRAHIDALEATLSEKGYELRVR